jgi:hypothetical protein
VGEEVTAPEDWPRGKERASSGKMTASSELEIKQRLAKLSERDRLAMSVYLLRLKYQSKSGRRGISKLMKEMDSGKKTKLSQLATDLGHA